MSEEHYYAVDNLGMATLCVDLRDAIDSAAEYTELYPKRAPYTVATMAEVGAKDAPNEDAIYLGCARMGLAEASDEEVLNFVRIAKQRVVLTQQEHV